MWVALYFFGKHSDGTLAVRNFPLQSDGFRLKGILT